MTVELDDRVRCGAQPDDVARVIEHVLVAEAAGQVEVGVVLLDAPAMQALNREHRGKDEPTDVLSFPIDEDGDELGGVTRMLGDIVICVDVLRQQAADNDVAVGDELADLLVHGTLHLLGYDHDTDAGEMLALQDRLIDGLAPVPLSSP